MTCCVAPREPGKSGAAATAGTEGSAPQRAGDPPRVRFEPCRGFVGTDRPVIAEDGEGPKRAVSLKAFELETVAVTNRRFARFVAATGYVTEAERYGWSPVFRALLAPDAVHVPTSGPTPWWVRVDGACWHRPEGPGSTVEGREDHPAVQLSWNDAAAFAAWCGGRLPTEAEWEHAARGGLTDPRFPWGDEEPDDANVFCNIWQGDFPRHNTLADGYLGTSPVDTFAPNGLGFHGMAGNVWEWTADAFRIRSLGRTARERNAQAAKDGDRVLKGGSFLCHRSYCYRYRIAARSSMSRDSSTSNVGFRMAYG
jgi:formylglycine-generating enzyme required for sulfatase activity